MGVQFDDFSLQVLNPHGSYLRVFTVFHFIDHASKHNKTNKNALFIAVWHKCCDLVEGCQSVWQVFGSELFLKIGNGFKSEGVTLQKFSMWLVEVLRIYCFQNGRVYDSTNQMFKENFLPVS